MASLVAVCRSSRTGGRPPRRQVESALTAAPHRGTAATLVEREQCTLGIASRPDDPNCAAVGSHGRFAVAFEGRLDNRAEIARDIGLPADADLDVLLAEAFARHGERLPRHLRGRYLAVVTDGTRMWAWRDHLGFAACSFRHADGLTWVASEAKQVAAGAGLDIVADRDVVEQILWGQYDDETPSAVSGVSRLPKATVLATTGDTIRTERYWLPERLLETGCSRSTADLQEEFDSLMRQACSRVLTGADVVSLSGGLDSPAVAAYAAQPYRRMTGRPLPAMTTTYPAYPAVDETPWVQLVADELHLDLETVPHEVSGLGSLSDWTKLFDGPVPAIAFRELEAQYALAASKGYRTLLTGEIAEFVADMRGGLVPHLLRQRRWRAVASNLALQRRRGVRLSRIARQAVSALVPQRAAALACSRGWVAGDAPVRWLDAGRLRELRARNIEAPGRSWVAWQLGAFEGPGLSIEADDVLQAATGITTRRPWADVDLWEWFLALPAEVKFPDGRRKGVARLLLRGRLPDAIVDRADKTSFGDAVIGGADYQELRRWLIDPPFRLAGIDYGALAVDLDTRALDVPGYMWAKDLAAAHAFLTVAR